MVSEQKSVRYDIKKGIKMCKHEECECEAIEKEIREKYPNCNWNMDEACEEWAKRYKELPYNNVEYEEPYACCCPACGRSVCNWCA